MAECCRAEIDTSAPIESVREAAHLFGGLGYWRPQKHHEIECHQESDDFEEQAAELENQVCVKEMETLELLIELGKTKSLVEILKISLQNQTPDLNLAMAGEDSGAEQANKVGGFVGIPSSAPGLILLELKRAKANLVRTTNDLTHLRAAIESYIQKIHNERKALEMMYEGLASKKSIVSHLDKELIEASQRLLLAKAAHENDAHQADNQISQELQTEALEFKKVGEAAKCDVFRATSDIETTKLKIHTVERSLIAAQKMKEASRASEAVALAYVKALASSSDSMYKGDEVFLSTEEYSSLESKAQEAEKLCNATIVKAIFQVDEANLSKMEILRRVKEVTEALTTAKITLVETIGRVEVGNKDKLDLDTVLGELRSEHGPRRCSVRKSAKFKNSCHRHHHHRRNDSTGVNLNLKPAWSEQATRPTLSIGQILSQKILHPAEDGDEAVYSPPATGNTAPDISLRDMLIIDKSENVPKSLKEQKNGQKQASAKRKKTFGLGRFSLLLAKQSKKKKTIPGFKYCTGNTNPHDRLSFG